MDKEKLELIYTLVSNNVELTKEALYKEDITDDDIKYLIDNDRIYQIEEGKYDISYTSDLLDFAVDMFDEKNYLFASKAINKAYEDNPDNYEVINFKFMNELASSYKTNKFDKSIKYLKKLIESADSYQVNDTNMYIYLLNMIIPLPDELKLIAKYMKLDDVYIRKSDSRFVDIYNRNIVRNNAYFQKYSTALKQTKQIKDKTYSNYIFDRTIAKLLEEATRKQKELNKKIVILAKNDEIESIINLYRIEEDRRKLTRREEYTLKICNDLIEIRNNKIVPIPKIDKNPNFYIMIDNHDYKGALNKIIELDKNSNIPLNETINYILLSKINSEIGNTKSLSLIIKNNI